MGCHFFWGGGFVGVVIAMLMVDGNGEETVSVICSWWQYLLLSHVTSRCGRWQTIYDREMIESARDNTRLPQTYLSSVQRCVQINPTPQATADVQRAVF